VSVGGRDFLIRNTQCLKPRETQRQEFSKRQIQREKGERRRKEAETQNHKERKKHKEVQRQATEERVHRKDKKCRGRK
jgi:hypothetical protein